MLNLDWKLDHDAREKFHVSIAKYSSMGSEYQDLHYIGLFINIYVFILYFRLRCSVQTGLDCVLCPAFILTATLTFETKLCKMYFHAK